MISLDNSEVFAEVTSVSVKCSSCGVASKHEATSWLVNEDKVFKPHCRYGVVCPCGSDIVFLLPQSSPTPLKSIG